MKREKWTMSGCGKFLFIILFLLNSTWIFARSTKEFKGTAREITLKKSPADSVKWHEKSDSRSLKIWKRLWVNCRNGLIYRHLISG